VLEGIATRVTVTPSPFSNDLKGDLVHAYAITVSCLHAAFHNHHRDAAAHRDRMFLLELSAPRSSSRLARQMLYIERERRTFADQYELESDSRSDVTSMTLWLSCHRH
jgi:hypothetical protein